MFDIKKTHVNPSNQKALGDKVEQKGRGRPQRPNMKTFNIRMDVHLSQRLDQLAKEKGLGRSQVIGLALDSYLSQREKVFKLVEV